MVKSDTANKLNKYNNLEYPISLELEFVSFHTQLVLVEILRDEVGIDIECIPGYTNLAYENRRYWARETARVVKLSNSVRKEIETAFQTNRNTFIHKLVSPLLRTKEDLLTLQKLISVLSNRRLADQTTLAIMSPETFNLSMRVHNTTKLVEEKTLCYIVGQEIRKVFKQEQELRIFLNGNCVEFHDFKTLTTWYDIRNTVFLLEEVSRTIIKREEMHFNLDNAIKSSILREYVVSKGYELRITALTVQQVILTINKNGTTSVKLGEYIQ